MELPRGSDTREQITLLSGGVDIGARYLFRPGRRLMPYVGGGVGLFGVERNEFTFVGSGGTGSGESTSGTYYRLNGGAFYRLTDRLLLDGGLEYRNRSDIDLGSGERTGSLSLGVGVKVLVGKR